MKKLKFKGFKADWILTGTKTSTMRLFDDKNLAVGDMLELENSDTHEIFAHAIVTGVIEKPLGEIDDIDLDGHEKWGSHEEMLRSLQTYYGDSIDDHTTVKVIQFHIEKTIT